MSEQDIKNQKLKFLIAIFFRKKKKFVVVSKKPNTLNN